MYELAQCYASGKGTAKDKAEARHWRERALEHGSIMAHLKGNHWRMAGMILSHSVPLILLVILLIVFRVVLKTM